MRLCLIIVVIPQATILRALVGRAETCAEPEEHHRLCSGVVVKGIQQDLQVPAEVVFKLLHHIKHLFESLCVWEALGP